MPGLEIPALDRIENKLRDLMTSMATRTDLQTLTATNQETLRTGVAGIRAEITAQAGRITTTEEATAALKTCMASTDTAVHARAKCCSPYAVTGKMWITGAGDATSTSAKCQKPKGRKMLKRYSQCFSNPSYSCLSHAI
ncbi:Hypothetical predicted protein [Pelobates cultripes]|uniref:Uncharacterized protein n=1 Tax=Pelobates cultripes TaxID=61616 RepID=A0AAD1WXU2_PELCU|nr:Hypothetical predicted protein [Pelobates cultripes]